MHYKLIGIVLLKLYQLQNPMPILPIMTYYLLALYLFFSSFHCNFGSGSLQLCYPVSLVLSSTNRSPQQAVRGGKREEGFIPSSVFLGIFLERGCRPSPILDLAMGALLLGFSTKWPSPTCILRKHHIFSFVSIDLRVISNLPALLLSGLLLHSLFALSAFSTSVSQIFCIPFPPFEIHNWFLFS